MQNTETAIKVDNISKVYRIGLKEEISENFLQAFLKFLKSPISNFRKYRSLYKFTELENNSGDGQVSYGPDILVALNKISFEVKKGEVLGIIGPNGAGKSTLLKVLCKITHPTSGRAEIIGRVSSLLEVGTGFHPELTGRENIYLNGTILGMSKREIDEKFIDIVTFSGVERFIDTPVKRYSSGMRVRLAFSVAAYLEPEILIVDEVLAVGDIAFQKKCLGKMNEIAGHGRTVLLVSHNLGTIANLCKTAIWLNNGSIVNKGDAKQIIDSYIKDSSTITSSQNRLNRRKTKKDALILSVRLLDKSDRAVDTFNMGEDVYFEFDLECYNSFPELYFTIEVRRLDLNLRILHLTNYDCGDYFHDIPAGVHTFGVQLQKCALYPASYSISIWVGMVGGKTNLDYLLDVIDFSMVQSDITKRTTPLSLHKEAIVFMPTRWQKKGKSK